MLTATSSFVLTSHLVPPLALFALDSTKSSRRNILRLLTIAPLFVSSLQHDSPSAIIRQNCAQFLKQVQPVSPDALLWRGADASSPSVQDIRTSSTQSDLLDDATYGSQGVEFFKAWEKGSFSVKPSRAHIGTGDKSVAANWGRPVAVFPVEPFNYAFWENAKLIYAGERSLDEAVLSNGPLVVGQGLRDALKNGKEIMFEADAFIEVGEAALEQILVDLQKPS